MAITRRLERYVLLEKDGGLAIQLRQQRNVAAVAAVLLAALVALLMMSPWGFYPVAVFTPQFTAVTAGLLGVALLVAGVAIFYRMDSVLMPDQVVFTDSFGMKGGLPIRKKLRVRVVIIAGRNKSAFPWVLHVVHDDGTNSRLKFDFARRESLLALVEKMRAVVQVEIADVVRINGLKVENVGMAALKG